MLKQFYQIPILCYKNRTICQGLLLNRAATLLFCRKYQVSQCNYVNHETKVKDVKASSKSEFLTRYPNAVKYNGTFLVKQQPFSINVTHSFLRNFINELGHNMKIPYVYENGYSAAMCLEQICRGCEKGSDLVKESYLGINYQEWRELYIAIDKEIDYLDERTLVSLVSLYFKVKGFDKKCFDKIFFRFSKLLKKLTSYSVRTLCQWSDILMENNNPDPGFTQGLNKIWEHILNRNLKATELLTVYQSVPEKRTQQAFAQLFSSFEKNLPKISVYDLFMIGMEINLKSERTQEFQLMTVWIKKNLKKINSADLQAIMSNFTAAGYADSLFCSVLSEYLFKQEGAFKYDTTDKTFLEVVLEYCTISRYYDKNLLEAACEMFTRSSEDYSSEELLVLLKAVGTLNYDQGKSEFFAKVEAFIMREALLMRPEVLLEMAVYLLYVDRPLLNMAEFIFSPSFQGVIGELKDEDPKLFRKCLVHLHLLYQGFLQDDFNPFPRLDIPDRDLYQRLNPHEYIEEPTYSELCKLLRTRLPENHLGHYPRPSFQENYIELQFDSDGKSVKTAHPEILESPRYRKAILLFTNKAYCTTKDAVISDHLLGSEIVNIYALQNQGVEVVKLDKEKLMEGLRGSARSELVDRLVQPDRELFQQFWEGIPKQSTQEKEINENEFEEMNFFDDELDDSNRDDELSD